jgi:hypothetical protein
MEKADEIKPDYQIPADEMLLNRRPSSIFLRKTKRCLLKKFPT